MKNKICILVALLLLLSSCGKKYVYEAKPSEYTGYYNNEFVNSVLSIDEEDLSDLIQGESKWGITAATSLNNGYMIVAHGGPSLYALDSEYAELAGATRASDLHVIIFDQYSNILRIDTYPLYTMDFVVEPHIARNNDYIVVSGVGVKDKENYVEYSLFYTNDGKFVKETDYVFRANDKITSIINYFNVDDDTYVAAKEYILNGTMNDVGKSYLMKFDKEFNLVFIEEIRGDLKSEEIFSLKGMVINTDDEIVLVGTKNNFVEEIDGYIYHDWQDVDAMYVKYNLDGKFLSQEIISRPLEAYNDPDEPRYKVYISSIKQTTVSDNVYYYFVKDQIINLCVINTKTKENRVYDINDIDTSFAELIEFDDMIIIRDSSLLALYDKETLELIAEFDFGYMFGRNYVFNDKLYMISYRFDVEIYEIEMRKK
jgi:hypothetical protein